MMETELEMPPPLRILLVEDDVDLRASLVEVLQMEAYEVVAVTSGVEAVEAAAQNRFDLMITDIKMPGKDGLDALSEVKTEQPEVAGIVITGYSTEDYALRAARLQVKEYLKKPFELDPFLAAVDKVAQDKVAHFRRNQKELFTHQTVQHLATSLMALSEGLNRGQLVQSLERWISRAFPHYQDARERAILTNIALGEQLRQTESGFPTTYRALLPKEFRGLEPEFSLPELLNEDGEEADQGGPSLSGSLLNVALLFESGDRLDDAAHAFQEFLNQAQNPADRYLALFGLGRIARLQQRLSDMESHLDSGIAEAETLGGATLVEALTEKGILQALAARPEGRETLIRAQELAAKGRITASYALSTLALEHFYEVASGKREQIVETLCRPEYLQVATEAGGWLLPLLLSQRADQKAQLLPRLVRVCGKSYRRLMMTSTENEVLEGGIDYLGALDEKDQQSVIARLGALESAAVQTRLANWKSRTRQERELATTVRVFSFSGMRLYRNDEPLELKRTKPLLLLLYLLVRGKPVGEMTIYENFWPGPENKAQASLRAALSYLRKLLAPGRVNDPFQRIGGTVGLAPELQVWFDFHEFWDLVRRGQALQADQPQRARPLFEAAVKLYRGPFLENVYEDWAIRYRDESAGAYQECLLFLVEIHLAAESWEEALDYSQQGLNRESLSQRLAETAMQCLVKLGRSPDALSVFEKMSDRLRRELELEPSIEMLRLQQMALLNV